VPGPLEGLRVIDFGQYIAGPFGPMLLGDMGAEVIKIEPIRGDNMRPLVVGSFMGCQRGKLDIALDLKQPDGVRIALELIATADMVHHNMTLGTADRLGIGYEAARAARPDIIYCNNFMYGAEGPLAYKGGIDPHGQAAAGLEWEQGPVAEGGTPIWIRYGHGDVAAAMSSAAALLIALHHRERTGEGQFLWASIFHGTMLYVADSWLDADGTPTTRPQLDREQLGLSALYRLYETQDGWLQLAAVRERDWPELCRVLRVEPLVDDPRYSTEAARHEHRAVLTDELARAFGADLAVNWRRRLRAAGVPCEVSVDMLDGEHVLFDDELFRLGLVTEYVHPILGRTRQFGNLVTFDGTPAVQDRPTPRVGEDTRELLARIGYGEAEMQDLKDRGVVTWPGDDYAFPV